MRSGTSAAPLLLCSGFVPLPPDGGAVCALDGNSVCAYMAHAVTTRRGDERRSSGLAIGSRWRGRPRWTPTTSRQRRRDRAQTGIWIGAV